MNRHARLIFAIPGKDTYRIMFYICKRKSVIFLSLLYILTRKCLGVLIYVFRTFILYCQKNGKCIWTKLCFLAFKEKRNILKLYLNSNVENNLTTSWKNTKETNCSTINAMANLIFQSLNKVICFLWYLLCYIRPVLKVYKDIDISKNLVLTNIQDEAAGVST